MMMNKKCDCEPEPFQSCLCKPGPKKKKVKTQLERNHLDWVASQGCCICGNLANVHHIREAGEPRNDFKTIPLCYDHHQGANGIHHLGKTEWRKRFGHEIYFLALMMKNNPSRFIKESI